MKAEAFTIFEQLIPDLHDAGVGWKGTCYRCKEKTFLLKVHGRNHVDPTCANCSKEELVAEAKRLTGRAQSAPTNGNGNGKHETSESIVRPWSSARSLLDKKLHPLKWIVPGILPEGLTLFGGRPKQGKSWGLLGISIAVANGGRAFGKISVEPGWVLYLALEDGERRLQDRMRSILKGSPEPEYLDWANEWPSLAPPGMIASPENPDCISQLQWWLDEHQDARLVVLDTFQKLKRSTKNGGNGNSYEQDYEVMSPLQRLAVERRIALVLCTHTRKPGAGPGKANTDFLDEIQGSTGITGSADTIMGLQKTREEQQVCLSVRGRDVDEQDYLIEWDRDTCDWVLLGQAQQYRATAMRQAILQCLAASTTPLHYREVAARIGKSSTKEIEVVKMTLWRMSGQQQVVTTGEGRYIAVKRDNRLL